LKICAGAPSSEAAGGKPVWEKTSSATGQARARRERLWGGAEGAVLVALAAGEEVQTLGGAGGGDVLDFYQ